MSKRSLSKREADLVLSWEWEKQRLVTVKDIMKRLRCSLGYACKILHVLGKKGWIEPLAKGHYLVVGAGRGPKGVPEMNPYLAARFFPKPHFFAYRFACAHYGLLTQIPRVFHVAVTRFKKPLELKNVRFEFIRLTKKRLFGYTEATVMGEKINICDRERTVLDALDRPDLVGGIEAATQAVFQGSKQMNSTKLLVYLKQYNDSALCRRFGYLCELLKISLPKNFVSYLLTQIKKDPAYLGSPKRWGKTGERNKRWNLILNVPQKELLGEVRIG
ncbi:type IV toxin-antitoxin system AbiEi family antitoxin [Elusimicrobiota bacterium]